MIAIEVRDKGDETTKVTALLVVEFKVATTVTVPVEIPVNKPVFDITATEVEEAPQLTKEDISLVELSVNVPIAVNCWFVPILK